MPVFYAYLSVDSECLQRDKSRRFFGPFNHQICSRTYRLPFFSPYRYPLVKKFSDSTLALPKGNKIWNSIFQLEDSQIKSYNLCFFMSYVLQSNSRMLPALRLLYGIKHTILPIPCTIHRRIRGVAVLFQGIYC